MQALVSWILRILLMLTLCSYSVAWALADNVQSTIKLNIDAMPVTLVPSLLTDTNANWILLNVGSRLIEEHEDGAFSASIAESWEISPDFRVFTFKINHQQKFDDGNEISASDVKSSLEEGKRIGTTGRLGVFFKSIAAVDILDSNFVRIKLNKSLPQFMQILADPMMSIWRLSRGVRIFGGKFRISKIAAESIVIERKKDGQKFELQQMSFERALKKYKEGNLDIIQSFAIGQSNKIAKVSKSILKLQYGKTYFLAFNTHSKYFGSTSERLKFINSLNGKGFLDFINSLGVDFSSSLFPPGLTMGRPELNSNLRISNNSHATNVVRRNFPPLRLLTQKSHNLGKMAKVLFGDIVLNQIDADKPEWVRLLDSGKYDLMLMGFGLTLRDWDAISIWFESGARFNFSKLNSKLIDELLARARSETNIAKRIESYTQLLGLNDRAAWYVPLANEPISFGLRDGILANGKSNVFVSSPFLPLDQIYNTADPGSIGVHSGDARR